MKKYQILLLMMIIGLLAFQLEINVSAKSDSYLTYNEIMLSTGKLLSNFTEEEYEKYYKEVIKTTFWGINVYTVNDNVDATYISQTLYSVDNRGTTDIMYELDVVIETSNKTVWNIDGSIDGVGKGTIKAFKVDLAAKAGVDYTKTKEESRKETQKMKLNIEANSRAIVYLMGNAKVTNGVCSVYVCFINVGNSGFEYFTLLNQYPRMEKRSL